MTNREQYLKVKQERDALASTIAGLPQGITWAKSAAGPLEDEKIRKDILGEDSSRATAELEKKRGDIRRMEHELEAGRNKVRVMNSVLEDLRGKAEAEMGPAAGRRFAQAAKDFVKKLRETQRAEIALVQMREQVKRDYDEIGSRCPIEQWPAALLLDFTKTELKHELVNFIDRLKAQGYDVE